MGKEGNYIREGARRKDLSPPREGGAMMRIGKDIEMASSKCNEIKWHEWEEG